jgi:ubiquinone/menaquinone biosynthesis C-methylase UbiE
MILIRSNIKHHQDEEVSCYFNDSVMNGSDKKEFVANGRYENRISNADDEIILFDDVVFKADFIKTFQTLMPKLELSGTEKVLEMGAAHGWASVILKRQYPDCYVVASDLVPDTIKHSTRYEKLLKTHLNEKWAFNCRDIPFQKETFDRIFTFASFHHFGDYGDYSKSLEQMIKILKPQGKIFLLYEPSSPKYLYKFAFKRANKRNDIDGVDEDVLVPSKIEKIVRELGCEFRTELFPFYLYRENITSAAYYYLLSKLGVFQQLLVSTVNLIIEKKT